MLQQINRALVGACLLLALIAILAVSDNLTLQPAQAQQNPTATGGAGGDAASALAPTVVALAADVTVLKREQQQTATETAKVAAETAKVAAEAAKIAAENARIAVAAENQVAETTKVHQEITKIQPILTAQNDILAQMYQRMTKEDNRVIRAIGYGTAKGEPDLAIITVNVETQAPSAAQGLTVVNAQVQRLRTQVLALGIPADKIDIAGPVVAQTFDERQRVVGFKVTIPVVIGVKDPAKSGAQIEAISKLAGPQLKSIESKQSDPTAVKIKAREAALKDARVRAELYAKAAGGTLGQVLEISEDFIPIEQKIIDPNKPQIVEERVEVMIVFELK